MKQIDKNDVDISRLFNWGKEFKIDTPQGTLSFWMKILGDADLNRARVYGLRESASLRKKLKDEESDERLALVPDFDVTEKDKAIEAILIYKATELMDAAQKKVELKYPKEPGSEATLEEHEAFQKEIDEWPAYVEGEIKKVYDKEINTERKQLAKLKEDELLKVYEETLINKLCENEMMRGFQDMCIFYATFADVDYKERLFGTIDDFLNLPTQIKENFYVFYSTLNIPTEELKKSPEATQ